jgi:hypothetical protein
MDNDIEKCSQCPFDGPCPECPYEDGYVPLELEQDEEGNFIFSEDD